MNLELRRRFNRVWKFSLEDVHCTSSLFYLSLRKRRLLTPKVTRKQNNRQHTLTTTAKTHRQNKRANPGNIDCTNKDYHIRFGHMSRIC